jgi:branched-chain amino acid transport system ATP-binding protein
LLLDEPAAGLSAKERITMVNLLKQLQRDVTVLLIEHDMDIALGLADQVTVMHEGTVIAQGTPDEISNNALVQEIYLGGSVHV